MAGGNVEIKFVADSSDLRAELGKVATSLDGVADATQGATNDMRKGLDGASKSAGDLAKKVPSVAGGAKTAGAALSGLGADARAASSGVIDFSKYGTIAIGATKNLGAVAQQVSPEFAALTDNIGAAAQHFNLLQRGGLGAVAVLGPVAAAAGVATVAYRHFKSELDAANAALDVQRGKLEAVQDMHRKVKEAVLLAALAQKKMTQAEFDAISAAQSATDLTAERRAALTEERQEIKQKILALTESTAAEKQAATSSAIYSAQAAATGGRIVNFGTVQRATSAATSKFADDLSTANQALKKNQTNLDILTGVEDRYTSAVLASKTGVESKSAAVSKAAEVEAEIDDGRLAALEQLQSIWDAQNQTKLEGAELLRANAAEELETIQQITDAHVNDWAIRTEAQRAAGEVNKNLQNQLRSIEKKNAAARELESKKYFAGEKTRKKQHVSDTIGANAELAASTAQLFSAMASTVGETDKDAARTLFAIWKGLSLAHVGLKTAEGLMTAAALPPPIDIIKSAAVVTSAAASTVIIASTKPPFHSGTGMVKAPDRTNEINARLRSGEAVSTPLGAETIGRGTIEAANAGVPIGGGSSPTVFMYEHRAFTRFIRDNVRGVSGGLADEINSGRAIGQRAIGR